MSTPREDGFRMPADWEPHARCWMAWPCRAELWGDRLEAARQVVADVAEAVAEFEPVTIIARPDLTAGVSLYLRPGVSVLPLEHDDSWTRDAGPCFLVDAAGGLGGVAFRFNGWGEAWPDHAQDARLARRMLAHVGARSYASDLVLEGGAVITDGEGTAILCEPSVLDPRRNPAASRTEVEARLADLLAIERVIWLPQGLIDDEALGHVENVACFAKPGVVLALTCEDEKDANHAVLSANLDLLRQATDARGRQLEVVGLPQPRRRDRGDGRRLTLSYTSLYVANGGVVMPSFADAADKGAYRAVSAAFPGRTIVQVEAIELLYGGGGIRAVTRPQPAAPS